MSWVTVIWSMVASACLTLAVLHLLVWFKRRAARSSLFFSMTAVATDAMAGNALWIMRPATTGEFGMMLQWTHVPWLGAYRQTAGKIN
jgi:two-component system, LuxR family, sensor kinase FixL